MTWLWNFPNKKIQHYNELPSLLFFFICFQITLILIIFCWLTFSCFLGTGGSYPHSTLRYNFNLRAIVGKKKCFCLQEPVFWSPIFLNSCRSIQRNIAQQCARRHLDVKATQGAGEGEIIEWGECRTHKVGTKREEEHPSLKSANKCVSIIIPENWKLLIISWAINWRGIWPWTDA